MGAEETAIPSSVPPGFARHGAVWSFPSDSSERGHRASQPQHLKDAELGWGWGAHTDLFSAAQKGPTWAAVRFSLLAEGGLSIGWG